MSTLTATAENLKTEFLEFTVTVYPFTFGVLRFRYEHHRVFFEI